MILMPLVKDLRCPVHPVHPVHSLFYVLGKRKDKCVFHVLNEYGWLFHLDEVAVTSQAAAIPSPAPPYLPRQRTLYRIPLAVPKTLLCLPQCQPSGKPVDSARFWYHRRGGRRLDRYHLLLKQFHNKLRKCVFQDEADEADEARAKFSSVKLFQLTYCASSLKKCR